MTTLDAPTREYCLVRRERTSSPLQALVLLNDPQFIEAARALAQRELLTHKDDARVANEAAIASAFERLASRRPSEREGKVLLGLFEQQLAYYQGHVEDAKGLLAIGESKRDESVDPARLAAMTVVVQAIMNLDDVVAK
jgi:hypothetical protein